MNNIQEEEEHNRNPEDNHIEYVQGQMGNNGNMKMENNIIKIKLSENRLEKNSVNKDIKLGGIKENLFNEMDT